MPPYTFANLLTNIFFNITGRHTQHKTQLPLKAGMPRVSLRRTATLALLTLCLGCGLFLSAHVAASDAQQKRQAKPAVAAAAFVVTKTADTNDYACDADCSLREAIIAANALPTPSSITFALPADSVISIASGPITINSNVTIDGSSSPRLIVDANNTSSIFSVNADVFAAIANLTVTNGHDTIVGNGNGGGCISNAGTLTLTNVTVRNGFTQNGNGGGIRNKGNLTVIGSTFNDNFSYGDGGAGIYNSGTLTVTNSNFVRNKASNSGSTGGGILNELGTASVSNSTFTDNYASATGGALTNHRGTLSVTNSTFDTNSSQQPGGAIRSNNTTSISNSVLSNNFSSQSSGGGLYVAGGTTTVTGTIIRNSRVDHDGGGVMNYGYLYMSGSIISANQSPDGGSGIQNQGNCTLTDSTVSNNFGGGGSSSGILNNGTLTIVSSTINNNSGRSGGLENNGGGTTNILNSTISNNVSGSDGAGITNWSGTLNLYNSTISHNSNSAAPGFGTGSSGITNKGGASANIINTIIANNTPANFPDARGAFTSQGHNLIGIVDNATGFTASGDQTGTSANPLDPHLGALQYNGGLTRTRALLPGSPAIEAGTTTLLTDQRGVSRPQGASSDIGAFEVSPNDATPAMTFTVTKTADTNDGVCDADCSLREAIAAANASTGMSTITFALPADSVIMLASGELTINSNLTIDGSNAPRLIVDAHTASRVFVVNTGVEVTIANLTATNGHDVPFISSGGGCIFNSGILTLTNATVSNGLARFGNGGGILNTGTLTLTNTTVSGSSSTNHDGGMGIYNNGTLTVTNSTFASNVNGAGDAGVRGGGIFNANGIATVTNSTFSSNRAYFGGGISNIGGTLTVSGSTFSNNNVFGGGGGISTGGGTASISNSTINNNFSSHGSGGGLACDSGTLNVTNSTIRDNSGFDGEGGGLSNSGTTSLSNSTISGNSSDFGGGGITNNRGTLTLTSSTVSNNSGRGSNGTGINNFGNSTLNLMNSTVNNNGGSYGGIYNAGALNVSNSTISNNTGDVYGGGITNQGGTLTLRSSTVSHNTAINYQSYSQGCGGVFNYPQSRSVIISNTIIANNTVVNNPASGTLDVRGAFNSQGHNLIGIVDGGTGSTGTGDQIGTSANPIDPLLGPLQNNGGATQTRALLPGSPALDTGETFLPTDQRGVPRPQGAASDIGAFELESNVTPTFVAVSGTITFEGHGLAGVTVTLSGDANATTTTDANGFYVFNNLNGGSYTVSVSKPGFMFTPASRNVVSNGRNQAADFVAVSTLNNGQPSNGRLLISEFRLRGPIPTSTPVASGNEQGQLDEFIELYNNTDAPQDITGYRVDTSTGFSIALPDGVILPARGHFLIVNAGYSLNAYATSDLSYQGVDLDSPTGLAVLDSSNNVLDAVGFTASPATYREGAGLTQTITNPGEYSFVRRLASGVPQDTGNSSADFILVSTTGSFFGAPTILGAPGPENFSSPIVKNNPQFPGNYIDPMACASCAPNRVIEGTSPRILKIRRTYTNLTGGDITRLRFRIIDLTTLGNQASGEADLRVISSNAEVINLLSGATPTANALTREEPPNQTATGQDGGLNTTITDNTITLATPLANNAKVSVNYWLRIVAGGRFRFFVNIEALP